MTMDHDQHIDHGEHEAVDRQIAEEQALEGKLQPLELSQTNRPLDVIRHWKESGYLYLDPPYQRGDVWGPIRRRNLIRSILLRIPIPSMIINHRGYNGGWGDDFRIAVIDGKQRMTTILMLLESKLAIPGEWVGLVGEVMFDEMPKRIQRGITNEPIAVSEGRLDSLEQEREVFELVNFGGVPQGRSDS